MARALNVNHSHYMQTANQALAGFTEFARKRAKKSQPEGWLFSNPRVGFFSKPCRLDCLVGLP